MPTPEAKSTSKELLPRSTDTSPERLWQTALGALQFKLTRNVFDTWIRDLEPVSFENDILVLNVANEYAQKILQVEYQEQIRQAVVMALGHEVEIQIAVPGESRNDATPMGNDRFEPDPSPVINDIDAPDKDPRLEILFQFRRNWEKVVDPEKVVSISRYFVKYWLPILGPDYASAVLAFKQLRFLHNAEPGAPFQVYVSKLLEWQGISKSTYYRRMENPHPLLSWFVEEAPGLGPEYEHPAPGIIRQKPNQYIVHGGVPLSPPHQLLVRKLLLELGAGANLGKTLSALEAFLKTSDSDLRRLLDDSFTNYLEQGNVDHPDRALTVSEIVRDILGNCKLDGKANQLHLLAEEIENKIVRPDQIINLTWYFVREWQALLKSGAFWLIVFLRSMGFYDKRTSEIRNIFWIEGGFNELGQKIGVSSETISGWFGGNRKSQNSSQFEHMSRFVQELERARGHNGNNRRSISIKLSVEMLDPLTSDGEELFTSLLLDENDDFPAMVRQLEHSPEKWDSSETDHPEIRDSRPADTPEKRDPVTAHIPENRDSRKAISPEMWDSSVTDSPEFWDRVKDSLNTLSDQKTTDLNTSIKTTSMGISQLVLPMIYGSETLKREDLGRRGLDWNLENLLKVNTIPPEQRKALQRLDKSGQDFVAWLLYAFSQEGRGIKKPAFFAAKRLLEDPPNYAGEHWQRIASRGPEYVATNLRLAMDPLEGVVDPEWVSAMGKQPRDQLERLARALALDYEVEVI